MPYTDPDKARLSNKLAARRRRQNPEYAEKQRVYQRAYHHNTRKLNPEEVCKMRSRASKAYREKVATEEGRAELNARQKVYVREHFRRVLEAKAGRSCPVLCEICERPDVTGKRLAFDHDHKTGAFRGWICSSCNNALGRIGDDPVLARKLAEYLEAHQG